MTAVIYCRVSSREQVEGTSLEMQEKLCREFAERNKLQILGVFLDKGESAKTANRTQFTAAIQLCAKRTPRVDRLIVHKLDRFARNQADHVTVRTLLKRYGTELVSVSEPINESPIGKALEGMLSVFAEFDNNVRAERCSAGMLARLQQGVWVWGAPIGYYRPRKGTNITPDPASAPFIRMAFEEYSSGNHTFETLASYLSQRGLRTRSEKRPIKQHMEKVLKNHIYYGEMKVWDKSFKGAFEPIISEELFWRCQSTRKTKSAHAQRRTAENPHFPLRRFVLCNLCEKPLTGSTSIGRMGRGYPYYHHQFQGCVNATFVPAPILETAFSRLLATITPTPQFFALFSEILKRQWFRLAAERREVADQLHGELATLQDERNQVFELHRAGKYNDEEFSEQKRLLGERIRSKHLLLERHSYREDMDLAEALEAFKWSGGNLAQIWEGCPHPMRRRFQKLVFPKKLPFDGIKFGTASLAQIFQQTGDFPDNLSKGVDLGRIELPHPGCKPGALPLCYRPSRINDNLTR